MLTVMLGSNDVNNLTCFAPIAQDAGRVPARGPLGAPLGLATTSGTGQELRRAGGGSDGVLADQNQYDRVRPSSRLLVQSFPDGMGTMVTPGS